MTKPIKFIVFSGDTLIGEYRFEQDMLKIGRLASAHLRLDDDKVSRLHIVIEATLGGEEYSAIDMGSPSGTLLNGKTLSKAKLSHGDELRLGDTRLVVSFQEPLYLWKASPEEIAAAGPTGEIVLPPKPAWEASPDELAAAGKTGEIAVNAQPNWEASPSELAAAGPTGEISVQPSDILQAVPASANLAPEPVTDVVPTPAPSLNAHLIQQPPPQTDVAKPTTPFVQAMNPAAPISSPRVPNNLATENLPDSDRALEIKTIWGDSVIDSINVFDQSVVTMGDERRVEGWGPLQKVLRCDIEVPSRGLLLKTFPLAENLGPGAANYTINIPSSCQGRIERADGTVMLLSTLQKTRRLRASDAPGAHAYALRPSETLYLEHGTLVLQIRYVEKQWFVPPPVFDTLNYTWVNVLILAAFVHFMMILSFVTAPTTEMDLTEDLFKNNARFAQYKLTPEEQKKQVQSFLLSKLKAGEPGAKAAGKEGKAGRKDYKGKKQGRMAIKGDPNIKELARGTLAQMFGVKGNLRRSYLFGTGGLGGELKGALGGVTGAEIGDATGNGGLGLRGTGPGGGGLSLNSVGLGAYGSKGRGGGQGGYGNGVGGLGKKSDRDINISAGSPIIMGSLDKELIRRVIKAHIAQIRYCYEKELQKKPGLFGKVATQFVIAGDGTVQSSKVAQSTMNNREVGRCVTSKIRTWQFPKPKGGGIVIVKYPFIFKQS